MSLELVTSVLPENVTPETAQNTGFAPAADCLLRAQEALSYIYGRDHQKAIDRLSESAARLALEGAANSYLLTVEFEDERAEAADRVRQLMSHVIGWSDEQIARLYGETPGQTIADTREDVVSDISYSMPSASFLSLKTLQLVPELPQALPVAEVLPEPVQEIEQPIDLEVVEASPPAATVEAPTIVWPPQRNPAKAPEELQPRTFIRTTDGVSLPAPSGHRVAERHDTPKQPVKPAVAATITSKTQPKPQKARLENWQSLALCAQTDPEIFFPEKGGSTREAKKVCASCEVKTECLEDALENDERFGIKGGLSERERRKLKKRG